MDWSTGKGKSKTKPKSNKGTKWKGSTAEEASLPETVHKTANGKRLLTPHSTRPGAAIGSSWDWNADLGWEEPEAHYQDW